MDFTYIPMILALFTLLAVLGLGLRSYLKTKSELPDDRTPHPEDKLHTKQSHSKYEPTPQTAPDHGTAPARTPETGTPPRQ